MFQPHINSASTNPCCSSISNLSENQALSHQSWPPKPSSANPRFAMQLNKQLTAPAPKCSLCRGNYCMPGQSELRNDRGFMKVYPSTDYLPTCPQRVHREVVLRQQSEAVRVPRLRRESFCCWLVWEIATRRVKVHSGWLLAFERHKQPAHCLALTCDIQPWKRVCRWYPATERHRRTLCKPQIDLPALHRGYQAISGSCRRVE